MVARHNWWRPGSLRALLLLLLLPGVLVSLIIDSYNDHQTLEETIAAAYDHALRAPLLALQDTVYVDAEETLRFHPPWYAQEPLPENPEDQIYHQVHLLPGSAAHNQAPDFSQARLLSGTADTHWELPPDPLELQQLTFYNANIGDTPIRVAALLEAITLGGEPHYLLLQVAQNQLNRLQTESFAWRQELRRDAKALIVVALLVWLGIRWGLQPLNQLRRDVKARRIDDTTPLDITAVPQEVAPLVEAVNHHIERHRAMLEQQSQFLADASHQLRTPLAVMLTQAEFALRENNIDQARDSLRALIKRLIETRRMTEQLLSLAQAQHAPADGTADFDLAACGRDVLIASLALAEEQQIDLGWSDTPSASASLLVHGHQDGIKQAITNILHNALIYTPNGGTVTIDAGEDKNQVWLSISDTGPGIPPEARELATQRFKRLRNRTAANGSGLGLAIAKAFIERDQGQLKLHEGLLNTDGGHGLKVLIVLPKASTVAH